MALELNLEKAKQALVLNLQKAGVIAPPEMEVGFAMDVSGSFEDEHLDGTTNRLLTRLIPWGLVFDPDKKADCFTFSGGANHVTDVGPITIENYENFVKHYIIDKVNGWCGGTDYSFVLNRMLAHFGWKAIVEKPGALARFFLGATDKVVSNGPKRRSIIIMITDGENSDKERTEAVLRESQQRGDEVYFLFIGISNQGTRFPFLESLAQHFANTGFVAVNNLKQFIALSNEELNECIIDKKLIAWLKS